MACLLLICHEICFGYVRCWKVLKLAVLKTIFKYTAGLWAAHKSCSSKVDLINQKKFKVCIYLQDDSYMAALMRFGDRVIISVQCLQYANTHTHTSCFLASCSYFSKDSAVSFMLLVCVLLLLHMFFLILQFHYLLSPVFINFEFP